MLDSVYFGSQLRREELAARQVYRVGVRSHVAPLSLTQAERSTLIRILGTSGWALPLLRTRRVARRGRWARAVQRDGGIVRFPPSRPTLDRRRVFSLFSPR